MTWHRAKYELPKERAKVVIYFGGLFRLATYHAEDHAFVLYHQPYVAFAAADVDMWSEFVAA